MSGLTVQPCLLVHAGRRGYIEQLPSGSYRAVVYAGVDPVTQRLRYLRETRKTYAEAEVELTRLQREVDQDKHPKSAITVAEAVEQWMSVAELEETTRDRYEDLIRLYILPRFGGLKIGRLDAELLERYYAQLHRCKHLCPRRPPKGHVHQLLSTSTTRKIHYIADFEGLTAAAIAAESGPLLNGEQLKDTAVGPGPRHVEGCSSGRLARPRCEEGRQPGVPAKQAP